MPITHVIGRDDLGGITFRRDDGTTAYRFGSAADALARELPMYQEPEAPPPAPGPDERTADAGAALAQQFYGGGQPRTADAGAALAQQFYGGGQPPAAADFAAGPYTGGVPAQASGVASGAPEQIPASGAGPAASQGAPALPAPPVPVAQDAQGNMLDAAGNVIQPPAAPPSPEDERMAALEAARQQYIRSPVGGAPANTAYQLQRGAQQVEVPKTFSRVGAMPYDEDAAAVRAELSIEQRLAAEDAARMRVAAADQELEKRNQIARDIAERHRLEAEQEARAEAAYQRQRGEVETLMADVRSQKVDPRRTFKEAGVLGGLGLVLAQGLGAFAAGLANGLNYAQQIVDKRVEQDIAAQEKEIEQSKGNVLNALRVLELRTGDREVAKASLRLTQQEALKNELGRIAAQTKRPEILQAYRQWEIDWQTKREELERAIKEKSYGATTVSGGLDIPRRGGAGRAPTVLEQIERGAKFDRAVGDAVSASAAARGEADPRDVAKMRAAEQAKAEFPSGRAAAIRERNVEEDVQKYGEELKIINDARAELAAFKKILDRYKGKDVPGLGFTQGTYVDVQPDDTLSGVRNIARRAVRTDEGRAVNQAATRVLNAYIQATTGAAMQAAEAPRLTRAILGDTDESARKGVEFMLQKIQERETLTDRKYGKDVVDVYKRQATETDADRASEAEKADKVR